MMVSMEERWRRGVTASSPWGVLPSQAVSIRLLIRFWETMALSGGELSMCWSVFRAVSRPYHAPNNLHKLSLHNMTKIDLSQEHSARLFSVSWLGDRQGLTEILGQVGSQGELVRHLSTNFRINNWLIVLLDWQHFVMDSEMCVHKKWGKEAWWLQN